MLWKAFIRLFTFGWNKQNSFHAWKIEKRFSMLLEEMWKWGRIKNIWQHGWALTNWNVPLMILYLKVLKILGYVIDITAVYQLEGISLQRGKAPPNHAAMHSWVFWRAHHAWWHVHNATVRCALAVMFPGRNKTYVFSNTCFTVACKFKDERNGNKTDWQNNLYTQVDPCDGSSFPDYTCMSCQPFFLKSIKITNEYNETKKMF